MIKLSVNSILVGMAGTLLMGCSQMVSQADLAGSDKAAAAHQNAQACEADAGLGHNVKLDSIRQLIDNGKLHAALAHLDNIRSLSLQSTYLRAEILRQMDRTEQADPLYRELLGGCMAGKGYHGLGLIAGRNNKISEAIAYLQKAEIELPIDVRVRNDLGYVLLLDGQFDAARSEFLTALELDGGDSLAATNMALLLSVMGKKQEMKSFAARMNIDSETVKLLRAQAKDIKASIGSSGKQQTGSGKQQARARRP